MSEVSFRGASNELSEMLDTFSRALHKRAELTDAQWLVIICPSWN